MLRDGKYLIARIEGSGQEADPNKVLDGYFRYKDYIKNPQWFAASREDVWSSKFIGLNGGADFVGSARDLKILEFQNPAYAAAYRLGGDSRNYSKVFAIQIAG